MSIKNSRYALQLAALQSKIAVIGFLQQYANKHKVHIYATVRNEKTWFMVLIGNYATVHNARLCCA
ncbi:SPOR domain-containing protein [Candidatus Enterovibrio altilux]|uniref:SPOR domain-containing protein n=1 Tax=Candidatus Enterovibrio altilux TaxID=1927128 RepID=UPI0013747AA4|nr:SPOR domain-containing protein [Candidatus Enterovibrio luxaltus]